MSIITKTFIPAIGSNSPVDGYSSVSGLANITKGGVSSFSTRLSWDINNNFTGTWAASATSSLYCYSADNGSNQPTLSVTYVVPTAVTKVYNGSSWVIRPSKTYNGSSWVFHPTKIA